MKKIKYIFLAFIISLLLFVPGVKAVDYGACIENYGSLKINGVNTNTVRSKTGKVQYSAGYSLKNLKYSNSTKTLKYTITATDGYYITNIYYSIGKCDGEITGLDSYMRNYGSNYEITLTVNKGYVSNFTTWGLMQSASYMQTQKTHNGTSTTNPKTQLGIRKTSMIIRFYDGKLPTTSAGNASYEVESFKCEMFTSFLKKYWTWVMILMPILTIILISLDLVKVIVSSDPESGGGKDGNSMTLPKVGSNAVKRMTALVVLLLLPYLLSTIFGLFNLPFCEL